LKTHLVFLSHGALELGELMLKVLEEEKTPEQWKAARIFPHFKMIENCSKNACGIPSQLIILLDNWLSNRFF